jgi:hypothetical protein
VPVSSKHERGWECPGLQEHDHRYHAIRLEQFRKIETVVSEPMDSEAARIRLLLEHEQDQFTSTVRPFNPKRRIQLAESVTQPRLELLLANRKNSRCLIDVFCLIGSEEGQRLARIIENDFGS